MNEGTESRVKRAEREVHACLNYGGIFHDGGPTTQELELAYDLGDLSDEIPHMRRFAAALNELADALEAAAEADQHGDAAEEGESEGNSPPDDEAGCYWHIGATRPCSKCSTGVVTMTVPNQLRICPACVENSR